jgi:hypothetical protein
MSSNDLLSNRGRKKFVDGGNQFVYDRRSADGNVTFWRCDQKNNGCHARLDTNSNDVVVKRMHGANAAAVQVNIIRTAIKRRSFPVFENLFNESVVLLVVLRRHRLIYKHWSFQTSSRCTSQHADKWKTFYFSTLEPVPTEYLYSVVRVTWLGAMRYLRFTWTVHLNSRRLSSTRCMLYSRNATPTCFHSYIVYCRINAVIRIRSYFN